MRLVQAIGQASPIEEPWRRSVNLASKQVDVVAASASMMRQRFRLSCSCVFCLTQGDRAAVSTFSKASCKVSASSRTLRFPRVLEPLWQTPRGRTRTSRRTRHWTLLSSDRLLCCQSGSVAMRLRRPVCTRTGFRNSLLSLFGAKQATLVLQ